MVQTSRHEREGKAIVIIHKSNESVPTMRGMEIDLIILHKNIVHDD